MRLREPMTAGKLAELIDARIVGPADTAVSGINEIHKVEDGDLTYADHPKWMKRALASPAAVLLLDREPAEGTGKTVLLADDPFRAFDSLLRRFAPYEPITSRIHPSAVIGEGTVLEEGAIAGRDVTIGRDCLIHAGVVIYDRVILGDRVEIQANTVIGSHAFYFKTRDPRRYEKMHPAGRVVIGNDVGIGANCTIDKGGTGDTVIGAGTKIDNQVHVGHGAVIGRDCLLAAQVGVAGKVILGDRVQLWGQVGVAKDLTIGDDSVVIAQSGVPRSLPPGKVWMGTPVREFADYRKETAISRHLPEIWKAVRGLGSKNEKT